MAKATVRVEKHPIRTYAWAKPSRYPILFGGGYRYIYPYTMEDRLLHRPENRPYTQIILENEYIRVIVLPELGGHLWSARDKVSGQDLFYNNQVVKPGLIALRGAWCATGVEWNFPVGHSVSTVSTVDWTCRENEDGSVTAVIGDLDRTTRMKWTVKITVHPGQLAFSIDTVLYNPTSQPHRYMYWENAGVHATEGFQFVAPAKVAWTWGGKQPFPVKDGVDRSWYVSHPRSIDYFMLGLGQDYFGYYDHKRRFGAVHIADYRLMPGKKFFTWGMAQHGHSWERNLTDDDGPYIELQCGLTPTQASFDFFPPQSARRWDEVWFSIGDLGYFVYANRVAALHLSDKFEKAPFPSDTEVAVVTNRLFDDATVRISAAGRTLSSTSGLQLKPGVPARFKVHLPKGARGLAVRVASGGTTVLEYSTEQWRKIRELPYDNPGNLWRLEKGSPKKLVAAAIAWLKWFEYKKALERIDRALRASPGYAEAHYWKGILLFDLMKFSEAARHLSRVAPRNEHHADALYLLGQIRKHSGDVRGAQRVAGELLRRTSSARLGRQLAAEVALLRGDFCAAAKALGQLAAARDAAPHTLALYAAALRRLGRTADAGRVAARAAEIDPLEYMALNELALAGGASNREAVMRGEAESYIELASYYEDAGLFDDAASILEYYRSTVCTTACNPLVYYHLGWTNRMLGRTLEAEAFFRKASSGNPDHVFPFRREDMLALEAALESGPRDCLAHYLLGCFCAWRHHDEKVMPHWTKALEGMGDYPVLLRRIGKAMSSRGNNRRALVFYRRAITAAPRDEELYVEADGIAAMLGDARSRIEILEKGVKSLQGSPRIRQLLAQAYYFAGRNQEALNLLLHREFDNWEGEHMSHRVYVLAHMDIGKGFLRKRAYDQALRHFGLAMEYPPNLKVGRPAFPRHAPQLYLSAVAHEALGHAGTAVKLLEQGGTESHEGWEGSATEEGYYKGLCLAKIGRRRQAGAIWRHMTMGVEHYGAPAWYNEFLQGIGYQGLEDWTSAIKHLEAALAHDKTNSKVKYHLAQARKHRQAGL